MNIGAIFPQYLKEAEFWTSIWPMLLVPVLIALFISRVLIDPKLGAARFKAMAAVTTACAVLGIVTGNVTGLSRDPAVGTVIPAVLSLVGGVFVFLVGTKGLARQYLVAGGIICLSLNLVIGIYWGGRSRVLYEANSKKYEASIAMAKNMSDIAEKQASDLAAEDTRYATALKRLLNEIAFMEMKAKLEKQRGIQFSTTYPEAAPVPK